MTFLTDAEKDALSEKIRQAESQTQAEIVTVIAQQSDGYRYIPTLWAALVSLSIPGLFFTGQSILTDGWITAEQSLSYASWLYPLQALTFLGLGMLFQLTRVGLWLIPASVKRQRAARYAHEQFFLQRLHETEGRTGVLIFVSVAEHYVEIKVDSGIAAVVPNDAWTEAVDDFITHVKQDQIAQGFDNAIEHCKTVLWEHFPAAEKNPDELPNHLIEV